MDTIQLLQRAVELTQNTQTQFEEIINEYLILINVIHDCCILNHVPKQEISEEMKCFYDTLVELKKHKKRFQEVLQNAIEKQCEHQFVKDLIDINPDTSQTIEYCEICGFTKK
jgi:hypothetical protein